MIDATGAIVRCHRIDEPIAEEPENEEPGRCRFYFYIYFASCVVYVIEEINFVFCYFPGEAGAIDLRRFIESGTLHVDVQRWSEIIDGKALKPAYSSYFINLMESHGHSRFL